MTQTERVSMELRQMEAEDAATACGNTYTPTAAQTWKVASEFLRDGYRRDARRLINVMRRAREGVVRPVITVDPAHRFGAATVRGIATDAIACYVWAGEDPESIYAQSELTRLDVLLACWYEATYRPIHHGGKPPAYRQAWKRWSEEVFRPLASGAAADAIPMPPDKDGLR